MEENQASTFTCDSDSPFLREYMKANRRLQQDLSAELRKAQDISACR